MTPIRTLKVGGVEKTVVQWAIDSNLSVKCIDYRIKAKWPEEEIVGLKAHERKIGHITRVRPTNELTEFEPVKILRKEVVYLEIDNEATGDACKQIRLKAGKALWEVANEIKVSEGHLSNLERGKSSWSSVILKRWNEAAAKWVLTENAE